MDCFERSKWFIEQIFKRAEELGIDPEIYCREIEPYVQEKKDDDYELIGGENGEVIKVKKQEDSKSIVKKGLSRYVNWVKK